MKVDADLVAALLELLGTALVLVWGFAGHGAVPNWCAVVGVALIASASGVKR